MKKLLNTSFIYAILAMALGVFYREFTKFKGFVGQTRLSVLHTHVFILGMFFFLIVLLLEKNFKISQSEKFQRFYRSYNLGLVMTSSLLFVRGLMDVLVAEPSKALDASVSGLAGLSHIILAAGIFYFFSILRSIIKD